MKKMFRILIILLCLFSIKVKADTVDKVIMMVDANRVENENIINVDYEITLNIDSDKRGYIFNIRNIDNVNSSNYTYEFNKDYIAFDNLEYGTNVIKLSTTYKTTDWEKTLFFPLDGTNHFIVNINTNSNYYISNQTYTCENRDFIKESNSNYYLNTYCTGGFYFKVTYANNNDNNIVPVSDIEKHSAIELVPLAFSIIAGFGISMYCITKLNKSDNTIVSDKKLLIDEHNCLEIGYIYNNYNGLVGLESIIYEFGNLGYIKIIEENKEIFVKKIKDYDGTDKYMKIIFDDIFKNNNKVNIFNIDLAKYSNELSVEFNKKRFVDTIENKSNTSRLLTIILNVLLILVVIVCYLCVPSGYDNKEIIHVLGGLSILIIPFTIMFQSLIIKEQKIYYNKEIVLPVLDIINCLLLLSLCIPFNKLIYSRYALMVYVLFVGINLLIIRNIKSKEKYTNICVNKDSIIEYRNKHVNLTMKEYSKEIKMDHKYIDKCLPYCIALDCFDIMSYNIPKMKCPSYFEIESDFLQTVDNINKHFQTEQKYTPYYGPYSDLKLALSAVIGVLLIVLSLLVLTSGFVIAFIMMFGIGILLSSNSYKRIIKNNRNKL